MTSLRHDADKDSLRNKAVERLHRSRSDVAAMTPDDVQELVYELQVHQIELEMQNEALLHAQAETELARQKYRDLYHHAPVGYLSISPDDIIVEANLLTAGVLGAPAEEVVGQKITRFIRPDSQDAFYIHKRTVLLTGARQTCQIEVVSPEPLFVQLTSQLAKGRHDVINVVLSDVTMMKKLEAKLMQMHDAAQAANVAKSQFLANMSHEIRTPLNVIIGIGHLLNAAQLDHRSAELLSVLNTSADSLHTLVNELLDFSKIESGKLELEAQPFDLRVVLNDAMRMLELTASQKKLRLDIEYDEALPAKFIGDAHRLRQVVLNLLSNALKFTETGTVSLRVDVSATDTDNVAVDIEVADTGIGIPKDKLEAVFDKFTQADASMTRRFGGTGLGLTIARRLVEEMGGDIIARSEVGKGSTFRVHLPLRLSFPVQEIVGAPGEATRDVRPLVRPRVLIVDDYYPNLVVMTAYLEGFGMACDVCTDGHQAVECSLRDRYAMIFMDVQMPVMDGLQATSEIRRRERELGLEPQTIVAVSAHVLPADRQQCLKAGMNAYIPKPFHPDDLKTQLARFAVLQEQ